MAIFCVSVYLARPRAADATWRTSVKLITSAGWAMLLAVSVGAVESLRVTEPLFPFDFNQRYLVLITWGFIVPFIWGFSTRWLPPLLGLRKTRKRGFVPALVMLFAGVGAALAGFLAVSSVILAIASLLFVFCLRLWEPLEKEPKLRGVHPSTPQFLRLAHVWLVVAALISIVAALHALPNGYAGAARHALTVGFFTVMVFAIGPRVLPAFFGVRQLWSARLMAVTLALVNAGCVIRVVSQILAYEGISAFAWSTLPLSAVIEMTAVVLFAANMMMTLTTGSPLEEVLA